MTMERFRRCEEIRDELRATYPATRFTVRLVGAGITRTVISWTDGPTPDEVRLVAYDHEGRRYVDLRREVTAEPAGSWPESPSPGLEDVAPVAEAIPYDDATCGSCGGQLVAGPDGPVHRTTRTVACPCCRCGRTGPTNRLEDDVVRCHECSSEDAMGRHLVAPGTGA